MSDFLRELRKVYSQVEQTQRERKASERSAQGLQPTPPQDPFGRRQATPREIAAAITSPQMATEKDSRVHPDAPEKWRLPDLPQSNRSKKRHNGRGRFRNT